MVNRVEWDVDGWKAAGSIEETLGLNFVLKSPLSQFVSADLINVSDAGYLHRVTLTKTDLLQSELSIVTLMKGVQSVITEENDFGLRQY